MDEMRAQTAAVLTGRSHTASHVTIKLNPADFSFLQSTPRYDMNGTNTGNDYSTPDNEGYDRNDRSTRRGPDNGHRGDYKHQDGNENHGDDGEEGGSEFAYTQSKHNKYNSKLHPARNFNSCHTETFDASSMGDDMFRSCRETGEADAKEASFRSGTSTFARQPRQQYHSTEEESGENNWPKGSDGQYHGEVGGNADGNHSTMFAADASEIMLSRENDIFEQNCHERYVLNEHSRVIVAPPSAQSGLPNSAPSNDAASGGAYTDNSHVSPPLNRRTDYKLDFGFLDAARNATMDPRCDMEQDNEYDDEEFYDEEEDEDYKTERPAKYISSPKK
jgi:hypothetical protein